MKELSKEAKKKRNMIIGAIAVAGGALFWFIMGSNEPAKKPADDYTPKVEVVNEDATLEDSFREKFGSRLEKLDNDMERLDNKTRTLEEENARLKEESAKSLNVDNFSTSLASANNGQFNIPQPDGYNFASPQDIKPKTPPQITVMTGLIHIGAPIVSSTDNITSSMNDEEMIEEGDLIIPAGSFMRGELLSGVTAPTMGKGMTDPVPSIIRITDLARLPNFYRADIKECFILAESKGSLATEMVSFRLKTLSCKNNIGKTIERSVDGYLAGENGMEGLHGRVVSKQATILGRTFIAEFLSGLSKAFSNATTNIIASPAGTLTTVDPNKALENGAWSGVAGATNKLAEFYMGLANEMVPVIEINAGRNVDIVFIKQVSLEDKHEQKK